MESNGSEAPTSTVTAALAQREEKKPEPIAVGPSGGLMPQTFDQLWRIAAIMAKSGMMPKGVEKPEQVFVAIQYGLEVGLSPMQAVQNIAVINGRPALWGDAVLGLVLSSQLCEYVREEQITENDCVIGWKCTAKRKDQEHEVVRTFTETDAKTAGLWEKRGKDGQATPWITYPQRMLQMRARAWALRDTFADVLKGLSIREEVQDIELIEPVSVDTTTAALKDRLRELKENSADAAKDVTESPGIATFSQPVVVPPATAVAVEVELKKGERVDLKTGEVSLFDEG